MTHIPTTFPPPTTTDQTTQAHLRTRTRTRLHNGERRPAERMLGGRHCSICHSSVQYCSNCQYFSAISLFISCFHCQKAHLTCDDCKSPLPILTYPTYPTPTIHSHSKRVSSWTDMTQKLNMTKKWFPPTTTTTHIHLHPTGSLEREAWLVHDGCSSIASIRRGRIVVREKIRIVVFFGLLLCWGDISDQLQGVVHKVR